MSEEQANTEASAIELRGEVGINAISFSVSLSIIPADTVEVENAETIRYLRTRSGTFSINKHVYLVINDERYDITSDSPPAEP